eukprot:TRINITY_DN9906_c0_g1_i2.p1 TRINITY_DN9906_c0_g1~~TRINITY_DN9906_c0_g1_i2.p1  ORF type:complete len:794 (-),score=145.10 TRINITY_DN9906_c0_g1_i2:106-2433(-)
MATVTVETSCESVWEQQRLVLSRWTNSKVALGKNVHPFSENDVSIPRLMEEVGLPDGWVWDGEWEVLRDEATDEEGWRYYASFEDSRATSFRLPDSKARRRQWRRQRSSKAAILSTALLDDSPAPPVGTVPRGAIPTISRKPSDLALRLGGEHPQPVQNSAAIAPAGPAHAVPAAAAVASPPFRSGAIVQPSQGVSAELTEQRQMITGLMQEVRRIAEQRADTANLIGSMDKVSTVEKSLQTLRLQQQAFEQTCQREQEETRKQYLAVLDMLDVAAGNITKAPSPADTHALGKALTEISQRLEDSERKRSLKERETELRLSSVERQVAEMQRSIRALEDRTQLLDTSLQKALKAIGTWIATTPPPAPSSPSAATVERGSTTVGSSNGTRDPSSRHTVSGLPPRIEPVDSASVTSQSPRDTGSHSGGETDDDDEDGEGSRSPAASSVANKFGSSSLRWLRGKVSKKKTRFTKDGFNLDLTYITPRIIAMGFPSEGSEGIFRNPMDEVQAFFVKYHGENYRIYNLCSERAYPEDKFVSVARIPFDDHNPPTLTQIRTFCEDAHEFLQRNPANVIAVHCKAGKGRTGTMIAAYMLYSGDCATAQEALAKFGRERTENGKGVTIPSQMRYVQYFDTIRLPPYNFTPPERVLQLNCVTLYTTPHFDRDGGSDPYFHLSSPAFAKFFSSKTEDHVPPHYCNAPTIRIVPHKEVRLTGDVKFCFFDHDTVGSDEPMFHFWINIGFIPQSNTVKLKKPELDRACKDKNNKEFDAEFAVELTFQ